MLILLAILANTIKGTYQYDPGTFPDNIETVNADKIVTRFDWNINQKNSLSISSRYMYAQRMHTNASNANTIHFSNDGYAFFSRSNSVSAEIKSSAGTHAANKLLITYTDVKDDREPLLKAFPRVRINDGEGAFIFGTDNSSTINLLTQKNWTLFDKYSFTKGRHTFFILVLILNTTNSLMLLYRTVLAVILTMRWKIFYQQETISLSNRFFNDR
jgi:hypothetical protein